MAQNIPAGRSRRFLGGAFIWLAIGASLLMPLPHACSVEWIARLLDRMHVPLMFVGCLAMSLLLKTNARSRIGSAALAAAITIALAALAEKIQPYFGRTESLQDFEFGTFGALLGAFWLVWRRPLRHVVIGVLVCAPALIWTGRAATAFWREKQNFPVLGEFTASEKVFLWSASRSTGNEADEDLAVRAWSGNKLTLESTATSADSSHCDARGRDWSGFAAVEFDCELSGPPVTLGLRIDSADPTKPRIRAGASIMPGRTHIRIAWPQASSDSLKKVGRMVLFLAPQPDDRQLRLSHVTLSR